MTQTASQNAMKHGLTSRLQLPADENQNYAEIHEQLISTFNPITGDELMLVGDMAFSRTLSDRAYRLINESMAEETRLAPTILAQKDQVNYEVLAKLFCDDPIIYARDMMETTQGVRFFIKLWHDIDLRMAKPQHDITLQAILELANTLGSGASPSLITSEAATYIALFLNSQTDSDQIRKNWLATQPASESNYYQQVIEPAIKAQPKGQDAWKKLNGMIKAHVEKLRAKLDKLKADYDLYVESQIRLNMGMVLVDKERSQNMRLMQRYALSNANRFDRLANKLRMLIDKRMKASELEKKKQEAEVARQDADNMGLGSKKAQSLSGKSPHTQPAGNRQSPERPSMIPAGKAAILMDWMYDVIERDGKVEYVHKVRVGSDVMTLDNIPMFRNMKNNQGKLMVSMICEATSETSFFKREAPTGRDAGMTFDSLDSLWAYMHQICKNENLTLRAIGYSMMFHEKIGRVLVQGEALRCLAVARAAINGEAELAEVEPVKPVARATATAPHLPLKTV